MQRYGRYRELIAHELRERGGASGLADGIDEDTAATLLLAALDGLQLQALLEPTLDFDAFVRRLFDLLFPGAAGDLHGRPFGNQTRSSRSQ